MRSPRSGSPRSQTARGDIPAQAGAGRLVPTSPVCDGGSTGPPGAGRPHHFQREVSCAAFLVVH